MPDGTFEHTTVEIAPMTKGTILKFGAQFYEDELGEVPATSIVYSGETYFVKVTWWFEGNLALPRHFCGKWQVKIDLESIGTAREYTSDVITVPMEPCQKDEDEYHVVFRVKASHLDPHPVGTVYLPAVTLATEDPCGHSGHMWGYCEGPSVMFIEAVPHVPPGP